MEVNFIFLNFYLILNIYRFQVILVFNAAHIMKLVVNEFETCKCSYMCQLGQCSEEPSAGLCEIKTPVVLMK